MLHTVGHRTDLDPTITDSKAHRSAEVTSDRFRHEGYPVGAQDLPGGYQVALAHLDRSGWWPRLETVWMRSGKSGPIHLTSS